VFLCTLAYYVEWHMRERLQEVLYEDADHESAQVSRPSIVAPPDRSDKALSDEWMW